VAIVRDVRERRAAEARIRQLTRLLETIVEVNQAVIRAQARQPLLAEACRVLVERGGFALAWVGLVEPDRDELTVAASAPPDAPYLQGLVVRRDDTPLGRGPTGTAAREGIDLVNEDTASNPALLPWRERQLAHGYRSSAAFPLRVHDAVVGVVNIYATLPGSVGPDETRLLDELVGDLGFALEGLEARQELRDLNESLERRVRERTAALEDANRELEAFSYSVSHDLRAPLRSIDGFSLLVLEEHAAQLDAEGLRLLGVVRSATHRMGQLIDALLDLSRASRRDLRPTRVAMRPLVASVLAELVPEGASHRPTFEVNELPDAWGDEALLRQVWVNLLGNALKFSARQAEPQVDVSFQARPGEPGRYLVRDNGVGFDSSHADRIFGVFQRLHSASEFEGHGVGLALVQRIVHRHGGAVGAEGSPGAGATFWFSLPDPPEDWS
jgi:signal transduction histidine kinase